jgi:predicted negative regulator of RcsB-dependent stress response
MSRASGGAGPGAPRAWRWDVALSFAGAQRPYVEQVASALQARGVRCFYDADEQIDLWGRYLAEELPIIYAEQAAAVVVFISAQYAARDWTRLERRAALDRAVRERREYVLPARFDGTPLPGVLSGMVAVDLRGRTPQQFAAMIADKLARLGISASAPPADAGDPARGVESAPPAGAVRAGDADPRRLGVHAAISVPGVPDDVLPEYAPRDIDAAGSGIRATVAAAARRGGFVLLVGGSSVGKTRCAFEAVKALLPEWWLVHPAGPAEISALAAAPSPRMVVWLDELQDYLDGAHGLDGATVRALLGAPGPVVLIGTLWPGRYAAYTTVPAPSGADLHARERQVLDLAAVIRIAPAFSPAEQDRARAAAARDPRLRVALGAAGYGLTQTLAAAPQLVARWQDAQAADPYGWAVLTAALDAARLGARAPLSAEFLRAAAPGYCTSQQQAEAPGNWFEQALAYATEKLHGAVAALSPAGTGIMGQIAGYTVADYLHQHALQVRRTVQLPDIVWQALVKHHHPDETGHLGDAAAHRGRTKFAVALYRQLADAGDGFAADLAAALLAEEGRIDEAIAVLRPPAGHHRYAAQQLTDLLFQQGRVDELRERADHDWTGSAASRLIELLTKQGRADEAIELLRQRAEAGDGFAVGPLADLLVEQGRADEAIELLRRRANASDHDNAQMLAAGRLDALLVEQRRTDELRQRAEAGDSDAARSVAELLVEQGHHDAAIDILRQSAGSDDFAAEQLADLLAERGCIDELRQRATAGDADADRRLAALLAKQGDLNELHERATAGSWSAAHRLITLLTERGRTDEAIDMLRQRADRDRYAADQLTELLVEQGRVDDAIELLRQRAADDQYATDRLADLLAEHGRVDELRQRAADGDRSAADRLADLLAEHGRVEELRQRAADGDWSAGGRLVDLLAEQGRLDELREEMAAGTAGAVAALRRITGHPQGTGPVKDPAPPS